MAMAISQLVPAVPSLERWRKEVVCYTVHWGLMGEGRGASHSAELQPQRCSAMGHMVYQSCYGNRTV